MAHEKIVTLFDSAAEAEAAKRNLIKAGFSDHDISLLSGDQLQSEHKVTKHPGFWQRLFGETDNENENDYTDVYNEAIESGGVVLSVRTKESDSAKAAAILDSHDSVDVSSHSTIGLVQGNAPVTNHEFAGETNDTTQPVRTSLTADETKEETVPLAAEKLEVRKRVIDDGKMRVHRYVVTKDVHEDISLQEQHADVFRRAINEPAYLGDIDWSEKTIEVAESHEQPVINKTAHVTEEVVVRTDTSERVETVSDTVRRQEVDIDHANSSTANVNSPLGTGGVTTGTGNLSGSGKSTLGGSTPVAGTNTTTGIGGTHHDGKQSVTEKVSEKFHEAKEKVEEKVEGKNKPGYDHSH